MEVARRTIAFPPRAPVAGILVMNVMLVSVAQRTAEVGLLMALGATARAIRWLFLTEAALLSAAGAVAGYGVGQVGALAIRQLVAQAQTADGPEMAPEVRQAVYLGPLLVKEQPREISVRYAAAGETLSVAVRLLGHVGPGEVLVCGQIGQLLSGWCELQACELPQEVGIPHRMRAFRVGARCHSVGRGLDPAHDS